MHKAIERGIFIGLVGGIASTFIICTIGVIWPDLFAGVTL